MRGRPGRLGIPSERWTPGEGADLKTEDCASSGLWRPSPGSRRVLSSPVAPVDSRYKRHGGRIVTSVSRCGPGCGADTGDGQRQERNRERQPAPLFPGKLNAHPGGGDLGQNRDDSERDAEHARRKEGYAPPTRSA
jgi:hypothetical protein